ncbi:MAG: DMT family transporter [Spirochaetes bacterium]|nr:DMT family transporter [Spirochaetota bacterium]
MGKMIALSSDIIVFFRVLFAALFLAICLKIINGFQKIKTRIDLFLYLSSGLLLSLHWISFFQSIKLTTVSIGLFCFSTFPLFVTFLEPFFYQEKLLKINILWAFLTLLGIFLIIPDFSLKSSSLLGIGSGIFSGFSFAFLALINRRMVKNYTALTIAFYQDSIAAIFLIPFMFKLNFRPGTKDIILLILLGLVFTGIAHTLFINGLKKIKAHTASIIACLEPVYGTVLAIIIIQEIPDLKTFLGGLLMVSISIIISIKS